MLHYKLLPAFHFSWEELPRSEDSCIRWNKHWTEICLRSIETMHWALMSCAMQCVTGWGGAIAGAVKLSNGPNFTSTSRMPMRIIWEPLWILAYYQIAIKLAEWLPNIRIHKQIGCHWSLSPLPLDWIGCLQSSANIFKIQKPTWRSVNQSWPSVIETQWRVPFFNLPEYFWSFLLTNFDPSWLYGCFSFHWELCSSFLLLQTAKQPESSQWDGFNGHHHSDQTNLHWFSKLYNYERNDSIVFSKAQIMFQLHKVISHCWC